MWQYRTVMKIKTHLIAFLEHIDNYVPQIDSIGVSYYTEKD